MEPNGRRAQSRDRWQRRAQRVSDAFGLVLVLILLNYVLASLLSTEGWDAVLLAVSTSAVSVVALTSSRISATAVRRGLIVSALAVLLAVVSALFGGRHWLTVSSFLLICLLAVAMGAVLWRVATSDRVTSRTILGAISVYTALGILFTWAYGAIDRLEGGGFFGGGPESGNDFLFFSYTTLTTTGYGDLVPTGEVGRMMAGLEMMLGQVFLVTLVAGLVSLWRPGQGILRRRGETPRSEPAEPGH
jgi:hypothetical protein